MMSSPSNSAVIVGASGAIGRALVCALAESLPMRRLLRSPARRSHRPKASASFRSNVADEATIAAAAAKVGQAGPVGMVIVATGILHQNGVSPEKTLKALDPAAMATVFEKRQSLRR